jgi:myo-inositol-1(or 4)-monophosphatase
VAGGAFIVQQAGGRVSDFSGGDEFIFGREIIASSASLFNPIFEIINRQFKKA